MDGTHAHPKLESQAVAWADQLVHPHGFCLANFDPMLVIASDVANLLVAGAYMFGIPFVTWRLLAAVPKRIRHVYVLGILSIYTCGISHFLNVLVTHHASYALYVVTISESAITGVVSWAFVLAMLDAIRPGGMKLTAGAAPGEKGDKPEPEG